jgi:hypothetical protein
MNVQPELSKDMGKQLAELRRRVDQGHTDAQSELAEYLLNRLGEERGEAIHLLVQSARVGDVRSIEMLKDLLLHFPKPAKKNSPARVLEKPPRHKYQRVRIDLLAAEMLDSLNRWLPEIEAAGGYPRDTLANGMIFSSLRRLDVLLRACVFHLLPLLGKTDEAGLKHFTKGKPMQRMTFGECIGLLQQLDSDLTKAMKAKWPKYPLHGRLVGKEVLALLQAHSKQRNALVHPKLGRQDDLGGEQPPASGAEIPQAEDLWTSLNEDLCGENLVQLLKDAKTLCQSQFMVAVIVVADTSAS